MRRLESVKGQSPLVTAEAVEKIERLQQAIETVIKGKREAVRLGIVALIAGGHLLVEDVPGVGKTTLAHALARALHCSFQRIQFTSDLLPSDVIGLSIYNQHTNVFEWKPGPIFANVVLADEINRTTPKTQSALLEAMAERHVTAEGITHPLPAPFIVVATQNPIEHHGTYPLPESQLDRFMLRLRIGYPAIDDEKQILRDREYSDPLDDLRPVMTANEIVELQQSVADVAVDDALIEYLLALSEERSYCIPDDIKRLVLPVFAHRILVSTRFASSMRRSEEAEAVLTEIMKTVSVPL